MAPLAAFMLAACGPVEDEEPEAGTTEEAEEETIELGNGTVGSIVGVADHGSFSLSVDSAVVKKAWNTNGIKAVFTAHAADRHNHPVEDGTLVSFWAEYGYIEDSCVTISGACSVEWTSSGQVRPVDGLTTVLAFTLGEDAFFDVGERNGIYNVVADDGVDEPILSTSEMFYDYDYDGTFDVGIETYEDFNDNQSFDAAPAKYRGTKCSDNAITAGHCAETQIQVWDNTQIVWGDAYSAPLVQGISPAGNWNVDTIYTITVTDGNGNTPPDGTTINITYDGEDADFEVKYLNGDTSPLYGSAGNFGHDFQVKVTDRTAAGDLLIEIDMDGVVTPVSVTLN
jgi:hypothetical protein